jgi:hypothetical protein
MLLEIEDGFMSRYSSTDRPLIRLVEIGRIRACYHCTSHHLGGSSSSYPHPRHTTCTARVRMKHLACTMTFAEDSQRRQKAEEEEEDNDKGSGIGNEGEYSGI